MHNEKECAECKLLKEGKATRSMGFYEEEIEFKMCRRAIDNMVERSNERKEWDYWHN